MNVFKSEVLHNSRHTDNPSKCENENGTVLILNK